MRDVRVEAYLIEVLLRDLCGHDRRPSAFVLYLWLWARTHGAGARSLRASLQQLREATGLSKSAVQAALRWLERRKLLRTQRAGRTAVPEYFVLRPWAARRK